MKLKQKDADLLLLDFDGTFYKFTEEFIAHCNAASGRTAIRLGAPLEVIDAQRMAAESYLKCGSSLVVFQERYGFTVQQCHDAYHEELGVPPPTEAQITADHLKACATPKALLSHSNRPWLTAMLRQFGLDEFFPNDRIFGFEDVDFNSKMLSEKPYRHVLEKVGAEAARTIMVEDTLHNLIPAKSLGMVTVYVTQGRTFDAALHPEADYVFTDLPEFLNAFT